MSTFFGAKLFGLIVHINGLIFFPLSVVQVLEVLDKEVSKEEQCEGLAKGDCCKQGQECLRTAILQYCRKRR